MAGAAHAVPSGFGWSASWQYYLADAFETHVKLPGAVFVHLDLMSGNTIVKSAFTFVPSSADDATLRTVGTGTSWFYPNASDYHLEVHRPGVDLYGDGSVQGGGKRSLLAAVVDSGVAGSCVDGRAADASISAYNWTCGPGTVANFNSFNFIGYINVTGCSYGPAVPVRCLMVHFPEPY